MIKRVYLEITDTCNLNCSFCRNAKGNSFMSLDEIDEYTDKIKPVCDYLYLHVLGEPLLHPDFENILKLLDLKGFKVQLVTNGILLDKFPTLLKHQCIRKLSVSIHAINNINVSDKYFETLNNLIENNNSKYIELRFYDKNNLNNHLISYLNTLQAKYSFDITAKTNSFKLKDNIYVYFQEFFDWPDINDPFVSDIGYCHGGKDMLGILHNGDIVMCCLDPKGFTKLSNIKETDLKSVLESVKYKQIIENLNNNKLSFDLCKKCTYRLRFSKQ